MEENDVNIKVPSEEEKSSTIIVTGAPGMYFAKSKSQFHEIFVYFICILFLFVIATVRGGKNF